MFLINVPVGALLLFLIGTLVRTPNDAPSASRSRVDWPGFWFVAASLGCLQVMLDRGQEYDWFASGMITTLCLVSAIAFVLLIWWALPRRNPIVNLRLFMRRDFAVGCFLMFMLGFMILGSTYLLPAFAQYIMGYRATEAGELLMPGSLLLMVTFPFMGRILNRVDLRVLTGIGILLASAALWWMTNFYQGVSFGTLALGRIYQYATHAAPGSAMTLAHAFQLAQQQATLLSYLDGFKALAVIFLLLLPVLLLARPGAGAARAAG